MKGMRWLPIVVAGLALVAGIWLSSTRLMTQEQTPAAPRALPTPSHAGTMLVPPRELGDFALTDTEGAPFTRQSLRGHWTLLAFGYTTCPDVCPTMLHTFVDIQKRLQGMKLSDAMPRFVFVSVDPERDDLVRLKGYLNYFSPTFLGATGPHPALQKITSQLGILYQRVGQDAGYLVDHSATILLLDSQARLKAVFSAPHQPEVITGDLMGILGKN
ncbi:protein SCO1 [Gammaproteobacteria bacterium]